MFSVQLRDVPEHHVVVERGTVAQAELSEYLKGATIDFVESLKESGFKVDNPNASGSCGLCGARRHPKSF